MAGLAAATVAGSVSTPSLAQADPALDPFAPGRSTYLEGAPPAVR